MAQASLEIEGTWEEIAAHALELGERRLRLTLLPESSIQEDPRLDFVKEIDERSQQMNPKLDTRDWLREGREGAMYGE